MTKTINLQISPKYQIGDKLIYFSGPNKKLLELLELCKRELEN